VQTGITYKETTQQFVSLANANIQLASSAQVTGLNAQLASYVPLAGGTMTGPLILNTSAPSTPLQAASKGYVDTFASGLTIILATQAATTANLNAIQAGAGIGATLTNAGTQAAFAVDGYSASLNDRILVKNQTLPQHSGIYSVTTLGSGSVNWVLTRTTDYDTAAQIKPGTLIAVNNGTVNATTSWVETATVVTVDTDPVLFSQFTFSPNEFLLAANNLSDVVSASTSRTNLGLGTMATKTASDNAKTIGAMVAGSATVGHIAIFSDTNGTISDLGLSSGLVIPSPQITTGIFDANGNEIIGLTPTASSVNFINVTDNSTGNAPSISATGSDANISLNLSGKGNAGVNIVGTTSGTNAPSGDVGEIISSVISSGSSVALTSTIAKNITSITLTPGDWYIWGNVYLLASGINFFSTQGWSSLISATQPDSSLRSEFFLGGTTFYLSWGAAIPPMRYNVSTTTTVYLSCFGSFASGTASACGGIYASRRR
jgi:hypothetical protein